MNIKAINPSEIINTYLHAENNNYEYIFAINGRANNVLSLFTGLLNQGYSIRLSNSEEFNTFNPDQRGITFCEDNLQTIYKLKPTLDNISDPDYSEHYDD